MVTRRKQRAERRIADVPPEFLTWLKQNYSAFQVLAWKINYRSYLGGDLEDNPQFQYWLAFTSEGQVFAQQEPELAQRAEQKRLARPEVVEAQQAARQREIEAQQAEIEDYFYGATSPSDFIARMTHIGIHIEDQAENYKAVYGAYPEVSFKDALTQFRQEKQYRQFYPKLQQFKEVAQSSLSPERFKDSLRYQVNVGNLTQEESDAIFDFYGPDLEKKQAREVGQAARGLPILNALRQAPYAEFLTPEDWEKVKDLDWESQALILQDQALSRQRQSEQQKAQAKQKWYGEVVTQRAIEATKDRLAAEKLAEKARMAEERRTFPPPEEAVVQKFLERPEQPGPGTKLRSFIESEIPRITAETQTERLKWWARMHPEEVEEPSFESETARLQSEAAHWQQVGAGATSAETVGNIFYGEGGLKAMAEAAYLSTQETLAGLRPEDFSRGLQRPVIPEPDPLEVALKRKNFMASFYRQPGTGLVPRLTPSVRRF